MDSEDLNTTTAIGLLIYINKRYVGWVAVTSILHYYSRFTFLSITLTYPIATGSI